MEIKRVMAANANRKLRGAFVECLNDFIAAIVDDTPARVTAFDGRQVTAVLDAVSRSLADGGSCDVRPAGE